MKPKALLVDDLATHGRLAYCELVRWFDVTVTGNAMEALILLEEHRFDVVIAELNLGAGPNGIDVMRAVAETDPGARRVPILFSNRACSFWSFASHLQITFVQKKLFLMKNDFWSKNIQWSQNGVLRSDKLNQSKKQNVYSTSVVAARKLKPIM